MGYSLVALSLGENLLSPLDWGGWRVHPITAMVGIWGPTLILAGGSVATPDDTLAQGTGEMMGGVSGFPQDLGCPSFFSLKGSLSSEPEWTALTMAA